MKLKEKIALNGLKRRLDRGAISLAEAMAEYKKITGQDPDDEFVNSENSNISSENSENPDISSQKKAETTVDAYSGYSPPGVTTEPVTDSEPKETEPATEEVAAEPEKTIVIEASPKRVDTQRTVKKTEE